ncbi:MAG TPA: BadF/BadG/BcrA/BcrD ATPase family protein [Propionibacteriaceae bacterium]|nr:BadF/BadG/BcrA/BcrD ATPase family protein [Propionibacteriaceae bacterium]
MSLGLVYYTLTGQGNGDMRHVIGIDAGGTATRAVLLDETGRCLGYGRAGAGNPTSAGQKLAVSNQVIATLGAVGQSGITPDLVMLTLAGGLGHESGSPVATALAEAGVHTSVQVAGDVMSAYFSATAVPTGYLVLSGTGAISARIVDGELDGLSDGIGWLLGDEGSGFWIGHRVVRAAAADLEGRGPATALTPLVMALVEDESLPDEDVRRPEVWKVMRRVYGRRPVECAEYAPLAFRAAAGGDTVARRILDAALDGLLTSCGSLIREDDCPIVLAGGLLYDGGPLSDGIRARYPGRCLRAHDGTAGAALLALRALGAKADSAALTRIHETLAPLLV